jgi:hypothetical protein
VANVSQCAHWITPATQHITLASCAKVVGRDLVALCNDPWQAQSTFSRLAVEHGLLTLLRDYPEGVLSVEGGPKLLCLVPGLRL